MKSFRQDANEDNRQALQREITNSEKRIQRLTDTGDLGTKWPELVCRVTITKEAKEVLSGGLAD